MKLFHCGGQSSSGKIAVTGHSGSHAPQSMHSSGWMYNMSGPSYMQSTGQTSTHDRSFTLMHGSAMMYGIPLLIGGGARRARKPNLDQRLLESRNTKTTSKSAS